jgi:hypothetical protein
MPAPEPFLIFTRKLNELGLRHMVSGSVAAVTFRFASRVGHCLRSASIVACLWLGQRMGNVVV